MTKKEFMRELEIALEVLSEDDIRNSLDYYSEIIDDKIEAGESEAEAVAALGEPESIAREIMLEMPLPKIIKTKCKKKSGWRTWEIVLLILGAPVWIPLLAAAAIIVLSVYVVIWSIIFSLWAVNVSLAALSVTSLFLFAVLLGSGNVTAAFTMLGAALALAGASIFMFLACRALSGLTVKLSAFILRSIKRMFVGKGDKQ